MFNFKLRINILLQKVKGFRDIFGKDIEYWHKVETDMGKMNPLDEAPLGCDCFGYIPIHFNLVFDSGNALHYQIHPPFIETQSMHHLP